MNDSSWRRFGRLSSIVLGVLLGTSIATAVYCAPSEEDIGASAPVARSAATVPNAPADDSQQPAGRPIAENTGAESNASVGLVSQPRPYFPYTIRSGDSLGLIAATFGVSVADLMRLNRLNEDSELNVGQIVRVPNPFLARERELSTEIDRLSTEKQQADNRIEQLEANGSTLRAQVRDLSGANHHYTHDLRMLPWWRWTAFMGATAAALMFGIMIVALIEWWILRSRFRGVAEMNESLRRLDFKYKAALAKAELRFQELYGRRRGSVQDSQERPKSPEELEIEMLNRQLKEVLERHLQRLGRVGDAARRARWRERLAGAGSPVEARSIRR
jgi:LysM repeat protein